MNVSLSRAKLSLIVVGDMRTLNINSEWRGLIDFAAKNQAAYNLELKAKNSGLIEAINTQANKLMIKPKKTDQT